MRQERKLLNMRTGAKAVETKQHYVGKTRCREMKNTVEADRHKNGLDFNAEAKRSLSRKHREKHKHHAVRTKIRRNNEKKTRSS